MSSINLVDPALVATLQAWGDLRLSAQTLPIFRTMTLPAADERELPAEILCEEHWAKGPQVAPQVRVVVIRPADLAGPSPALLHIHGGGYVMGSADGVTPRNRGLACDARCVVVSVDYRLAPETPHPGPVEDCYAALGWLHENAEALGVDRERIAVGGESAGGGLAASLALLARDRREFPLLFQMLIYPMLDDRTGPQLIAGEFIWTSDANRFGWSSLLAGGLDAPSKGYGAAARAEHLEGFQRRSFRWARWTCLPRKAWSMRAD